MSWWFSCCRSGPCDNFTDAYGRQDSTDIGPDYSECVGQWSISSGQLSVSSANAIAVIDTFVASKGSGTVELYDLSPGRVYRLYCGLGSIGDECDTGPVWVAAQYAIDGTGNIARVSLITNEGGGETVLGYEDVAVQPLAPDILTLCVGEGRVQASSINSTEPVADCVVPTGRYWGLGTGSNGGEHLFDNLSIIEHYSTNFICPQCDCGCEGYCLERTLRYTFVSINNCDQLDGLTGPILWQSLCSWFSAEITGVCLQPGNDSLQVELSPLVDTPAEYESPIGGNFELTLWRYVSSTIFGTSVPQPGSTCSPLYLIFGPFLLGGAPDSDELCCEGTWESVWDPVTEEYYWEGDWGTFYIIITDM